MHTTLFEQWTTRLVDPSGSRELKPRRKGKTMVMDKGLGWHSFEDLLETAGAYIDFLKIGFGTSALYPIPLLQKKIELAKAHEIIIFPGGTFLEVAIAQQATCDFFDMILQLGYTGLEVSDGTIHLNRRLRSEMIMHGVEEGLYVFTELGKKFAGTTVDWSALADTYATDLDFGASLVTLEARESGLGIGIYDEHGTCKSSDIGQFIDLLPESHQLLWEAPQPAQQLQLLQLIGLDVHLGNVAPQDVIPLEAWRRRLRADTFSTSTSCSSY